MLDQAYRIGVQKKVIDGMKGRLIQGRGVRPAEDGETDERDFWTDEFVAFVKKETDKKMQIYSKQTDEEKYHVNQAYVEMRKKLWEVNNAGPFRLNGNEEDDDELAIIGEQSSFLCPFTTVLMEDPHTSKICKHSFSKAIVDIIRGSREGKIECPVAGCNKMVRMVDLYRDKILARKIERYRESQEDMEAGFGDEDEEE
ncbi:hypothetical protein HDU67_005415 [Dinochytrium kinnereticum]|nr:hypothetical protein HDU67_005415 [Dinochytrium kinnereticum]